MRNLPTVSVHDIIVHPRDNDLILGTHGRSIWIFDDVSFLQELTADRLSSPAHLFTIRPALRYTTRPTRYGIGDKVYRGPNPPYGALITYSLKEKPDKNIAFKLEIVDRTGKVIRTIRNIPREAGINRVAWDLRFEGPRPRREERREEDFFFRGPRGPQVLPGTYTAKLTVGENIYNTSFEVRIDPTVSVSPEQLNIQQQYSIRLRDMQSFVNDGLRALDILKKQIEERKDTLNKQAKDVPREVMDAIETHSKNIETLMNILAAPE